MEGGMIDVCGSLNSPVALFQEEVVKLCSWNVRNEDLVHINSRLLICKQTIDLFYNALEDEH